MPQFEVSIPYTGIQTRIVLADTAIFSSWEAGTVPWTITQRTYG